LLAESAVILDEKKDEKEDEAANTKVVESTI